MLAVFGIGLYELLFVLAIGFVVFGVPIIAVVAAVVLGTRHSRASTGGVLNLQACPDCGQFISVRATMCPNCGGPVKRG